MASVFVSVILLTLWVGLWSFTNGISQQETILINAQSLSATPDTSERELHYTAPTAQTNKAPPKKLNVLFIVSDDLRPQLNAYQGEYSPNPYSAFRMHTPALDALAARSLVLTRAYAQFSVCGPSRASFMTGRRPDTTQVWDLWRYWREAGGNFTTIPQFFKDNGYLTAGLGKLFHQGRASNNDDPISWTEPYYHSPYERVWVRGHMSWRAVPKSMRQDKPLPDEDVAGKAV